jgi:hypothetical protein
VSLNGIADNSEWLKVLHIINPQLQVVKADLFAGGVTVPPVLLNDMKALRQTLPGIAEKYPSFPFE